MTSATFSEVVELLSFRLGDQQYCVDITSVREIRGWSGATPLPHAPAHLKGVINLRGTVLAVIDLAARLGMTATEDDGRKVIVVVHSGGISAGLLVDAVSDILTIPAAALQPPPDMGEAVAGSFIRALTLVEDDLVRVLDLTAVMPGRATAA